MKKIGSNTSEVVVKGTSILFSYSTPVAGWDENGAFRTDKKFSASTSKHINKYLGGKEVGRVVEQEWIEGLVN